MTHGHKLSTGPSRTYRTWQAMIQRCTNPNRDNYPAYGGRGITICGRWRESFAAFLEDMGERPDFMTLDRKNPDGNYEKGNCVWADNHTQRMNQGRMKGAQEGRAESVAASPSSAPG